MERPIVRNREEFLTFLFELLDHIDAVKFENGTVYQYVQAAAAWLHDADGYYRNIGESRDTREADWQLFADMLCAALVYE
jgi:hypothetical protein